MSPKASALGSVTKAAYRSVAWVGHWFAPERASRRAAPERWRAWATSRGPSPLIWVPPAYPPPALPGPMHAMLDPLRPRLLIFSRADVWPELTTAATGRGVPVAILGATVNPRSGRLGWRGRPVPQSMYAAIAYAGAVSHPDAARLPPPGGWPAAPGGTGGRRPDP